MVSLNSYLHCKWIVFFCHLEHVNSNFTCLINRVKIKEFMFEINLSSMLYESSCQVVSCYLQTCQVVSCYSQFELDYRRVYSSCHH